MKQLLTIIFLQLFCLSAFASNPDCLDKVDDILEFKPVETKLEDGTAVKVVSEDYLQRVKEAKAAYKAKKWNEIENPKMWLTNAVRKILFLKTTDAFKKLRKGLLRAFYKMSNVEYSVYVITKTDKQSVLATAMDYGEAVMKVGREEAKQLAAYEKAKATAASKGNAAPAKSLYMGKVKKMSGYDKYNEVIKRVEGWFKEYTKIHEDVNKLLDERAALEVAAAAIKENRKKSGFHSQGADSPMLYFDFGEAGKLKQNNRSFWNSASADVVIDEIEKRIQAIDGSLMPLLGSYGELRERLIEQAILKEKIEMVFRETREYFHNIPFESTKYDDSVVLELETKLASFWDAIEYQQGRMASEYDISDWAVRKVQWRMIRAEVQERFINDMGLRWANSTLGHFPLIGKIFNKEARNKWKEIYESNIDRTHRRVVDEKLKPITRAYRGLFGVASSVVALGSGQGLLVGLTSGWDYLYGNKNRCKYINATEVRDLENRAKTSMFKVEGFKCASKLSAIDVEKRGATLDQLIKSRICNDDAFKQCMFNYIVEKYEIPYVLEGEYGFDGLFSEVTFSEEEQANLMEEVRHMLWARYDYLAQKYLKEEVLAPQIAESVMKGIISLGDVENKLLDCAIKKDADYVQCFIDEVVYGEYKSVFEGTELTEEILITYSEEVMKGLWQRMREGVVSGWASLVDWWNDVEGEEVDKNWRVINDLSGEQREMLANLIIELEETRVAFIAMGKTPAKELKLAPKKKKPSLKDILEKELDLERLRKSSGSSTN